MKLLATLLLALAFGQAARQPGEYPLGPDSLPQPGVPQGRLEGPFLFKSPAAIPNTVRRYWIYVPAQYTGAPAANLLVLQDGQGAIGPTGALRVPQVLDNLIHKKEVPVTIGVFITPGHRGDVFPEPGTGNPNNRAAEYDSLTDAYTRMLMDELLPEIGKIYKITTDPAGRAIGGASSGAICAFTVAWHRPDAFRNVLSLIGSYTSIAWRPARDGQPMVSGGEVYPTLIRKSPIKPIKIFLQDGSNDLNNEHGSWFLANQQMLSALEFANSRANTQNAPGPRYQVNHVWGDGAHSNAHGGAILPDMLRWIWNDAK